MSPTPPPGPNPSGERPSPPGDDLGAHRAQLRAMVRDLLQLDDEAVFEGIEAGLGGAHLGPGEILFREGDVSDSLYFVVSGRLRATRADQPRPIGEIARGETVGELGLITGEPRSATVTAVRKTLVARMDAPTFERILAGRPALAMAVMRTIITRFRSGEKARRPANRPVVLMVLPITDGLDPAGFGRDLAGALALHPGRVTLLGPGDLAGFSEGERRAADDPGSAVARWMEGLEAESATLILAADREPGAWTRACLAVADEILLLARAEAEPAVAPVEALLLEGRAGGHAPAQTLVLVHPPGTRCPAGTAAWLDRRHVPRHVHLRAGDVRHLRRLARIVSGRAVGLVLSGGGARGLAHIGVLKALAEAGIEIDVIGGTSIGSAIGGLQAVDLAPEALEAAARRVFVGSGNPTGDYNLLPFVSLVSGRKTRRVTEAAVIEAAGRPIDLEDTWITFFCVAGNYSTATEAVLSRGSLSKSLLASFAIPGALPPIVIGGHFFVDGGTVNNLPVDVMERYRVGRILAVDLAADAIRAVDFDWVPGTLALLADRIRGRRARRFLVPSLPEMLVNASVLPTTGHQRAMRERADICFRPKLDGVRLLAWRKFDAVVRAGYDCARQDLAGLPPEVLASFR